MKILLVEDEPELRAVIRDSLLKERYIVEEAAGYAEALFKTGCYEYDCILLDIMLPDGNGLKLLDELKKQQKKEHVIVISARDSLEDKLQGLESGADDYLAKPFHLAELSARIRSVMRRSRRDGDEQLRYGNVSLNPSTFVVMVDGTDLLLSRKEYDILHYFMNRPDRLVDKSAMAEAVWGDHIDQVDNYDFIYAQIKNIRRKLKEAGATPELKAVYGLGYKLTMNPKS